MLNPRCTRGVRRVRKDVTSQNEPQNSSPFPPRQLAEYLLFEAVLLRRRCVAKLDFNDSFHLWTRQHAGIPTPVLSELIPQAA